MAAIKDPIILDATNVGNTWSFEIEYTAEFISDEIGKEFQDAVKIWEDDGGGDDDDQITVYPFPDTFIATNSRVLRRKIFNVHADTLDTEVGSEQLYAWVWLRRKGSNGPADDEKRTPTIERNP